MATYIPSAAGRALQETSANILRAMIERAKLDEQQRQFDLQFGLQQAQGERRLTIDERRNALDAIRTFGPYHVGKPIAESAPLAAAMGSFFQDQFDPAEWKDPNGLGEMALGEPTLDQYIGDKIMSFIDELPKDQQAPYIQWAAGRAFTGTPLTSSLQLEQRKADQALEILDNPDTLDFVARSMLGLPQEISVTLGGKTYTWGSKDEAQISLELLRILMQERALGSQADALESQTMQALAKDLVDIAANSPAKIRISLGTALAIIQASHGPLPEGKTRQQVLDELNESLTPEQKAAFQMYRDGVDMTPAMERVIRDNAPDMYMHMQLINALDDIGATAEQKNKLTPIIGNILNERGVPVGTPGNVYFPGWIAGPQNNPAAYGQPAAPGESRFGIPVPGTTSPATPPTAAAGTSAPGGAEVQGRQWEIDIDQARTLLNQAASDYLAGNLTDETLDNQFGPLADIVRAKAQYLVATTPLIPPRLTP